MIQATNLYTRPMRTCISAAVLAVLAQPSYAGVGVDTSVLTEAVTTEGVLAHMEAFQQIADENDGTREASGEGYRESVEYVSTAMALAGTA